MKVVSATVEGKEYINPVFVPIGEIDPAFDHVFPQRFVIEDGDNRLVFVIEPADHVALYKRDVSNYAYASRAIWEFLQSIMWEHVMEIPRGGSNAV